MVKRDFRSHTGSSEHSLVSESKFEPSVAIDIIGGDRLTQNTMDSEEEISNS